MNEKKLRNEYKSEIAAWDWDGLKNDAMMNDEFSDSYGEDSYHGTYLGTVFAIMPSGKYYTCWTTNQTDDDELKDSIFMEVLEEVASQHGAWVENGENDPCDMFVCFQQLS